MTFCSVPKGRGRKLVLPCHTPGIVAIDLHDVGAGSRRYRLLSNDPAIIGTDFDADKAHLINTQASPW